MVRNFSGDPRQLAQLETEAASHSWSETQYRDALQAGYPLFGLFAPDGDLLGFCLIMTVLDEAEILNIAIAKAHQGQGHGRLLLTGVLGALASTGTRRIFLEVRASNAPARKLYQNCGFTACGLRKNYYPAALGREDAILMEATP